MSPSQAQLVLRDDQRAAFLAATPWADATVLPLGSDASTRQYFRLEAGPSAALLMDAPGAALTPPCPPSASEAERRALGYPAMVRGSGSSLAAFEAASQMLAACGVLVPRVLAKDIEASFAIVEDLGDQLVAEVSKDPSTEERLYEGAADVLERLRAKEQAPGEHNGWAFQSYDRLAYLEEVRLLTQWYLPEILGRTPTDEQVERLQAAWGEAFDQLSPPRHLVHRDFHAENLLLARGAIGVIDFQDMMVGQAAYDWVSLIEDARRDIPAGLRDALYQRAVQGADDSAAFEVDYAILGAQRNAKILGLFARLASADGKRRYLDFMPRVLRHFGEDLRRPPLAGVRAVMEDVAPELIR